MQAFMPSTQPQGTHAFDPGSLSSHSAMQILNTVDTEEDGAEDRVGPLLDSPMSNTPAGDASTVSPTLIPPFLSTFSFRGTPSVVSSHPVPHLTASSSSSNSNPPPSSSLPRSPPQHDTPMGSAHSITTGSDGGSTSSQLQKRKHDAKSMSSVQLPSSKQVSKSKTDDLNPVIISNALNSTLNHIIDVMEWMLDATAVPTAFPTAAPLPSIITSPIESQTASLSVPAQSSISTCVYRGNS